MKTFYINVWVTLVFVIIFDVGAYAFLPDYYVSTFYQYRRDGSPGTAGRGSYPHGYFVKDENKGFDIGRNKTGMHWVDGISYPVWSNSLACFDNEQDKGNKYVYFAGDSFTWGYTPFEQKFGTIIEKKADVRVFKCGVTHTGQRHQFEKMVQIVKEYGSAPKAIFVFYYSNDVANDYAYPHTTVIKGWQVDSLLLDENNKLISQSLQDLTVRVGDKLEQIQEEDERREQQSESWREFKRTLKRYSLSLNITLYAKDYVSKIVQQAAPSNDVAAKVKSKSIYALPREKNGRYWYTDNPFAIQNKNALLRFKQFSLDNNAELVVVVVPPRHMLNEIDWHEEFRDFLVENKIRHIDLALRFKNKGLTARDIYHLGDAHFNSTGNKVVAEILLDEFHDDLFE